MEQPITPDELFESSDSAVDCMVEYLNKELKDKVLDTCYRKGPINIFSFDNLSVTDRAEVIRRFKRSGWANVEYSEERDPIKGFISMYVFTP